MLHFSEEYFKGETISGYYVRPLAKHKRAAMLEVLAKIDAVCKKHGITYFADWGTLLGAVRHGGFIPWDDDMDIMMRREDYRRFLQIAPSEFNYYEERPDIPDLEGRLLFHSPHISKTEYIRQSLVASGRRINFDEEYLRRFHGCPFVVGVDIFPLDYLLEENEETEVVLKILQTLCQLLDNPGSWVGGDPADEVVLGQLIQIAGMVGFQFDDNDNLRIQAIRMADAISAIYSRDESPYMQDLQWYPTERDRYSLYKKEWFDEVVYLPFENMEIPCPIEYDKVLTAVYGDYMTPRDYGSHNDKQIDEIKEKGLFDGKDPEEAIERLMKYYT